MGKKTKITALDCINNRGTINVSDELKHNIAQLMIEFAKIHVEEARPIIINAVTMTSWKQAGYSTRYCLNTSKALKVYDVKKQIK